MMESQKGVMRWRSFHEAREYVRSLGLKNLKEWKTFTKSTDKPDDIPCSPDLVYKVDGWTRYSDWLGNPPTLQEVGDTLGLSRERIRQLRIVGMPANSVEEAERWYYVRHLRNKEEFIARELGLPLPQFQRLVEHGMPRKNIEKAKAWIKENTYRTQKGSLKIKTSKNKYKFIADLLGLQEIQFHRLVDQGMPRKNVQKAKAWIKENTYRTQKGSLKIKA